MIGTNIRIVWIVECDPSSADVDAQRAVFKDGIVPDRISNGSSTRDFDTGSDAAVRDNVSSTGRRTADGGVGRLEKRNAGAVVTQCRGAVHLRANGVALHDVAVGTEGQQDSVAIVAGDQVALTRRRAADHIIRRTLDPHAITPIATIQRTGRVRSDLITLDDVSVRSLQEFDAGLDVARDEIARTRLRAANGVVVDGKQPHSLKTVAQRRGSSHIAANLVALDAVSSGTAGERLDERNASAENREFETSCR